MDFSRLPIVHCRPSINDYQPLLYAKHSPYQKTSDVVTFNGKNMPANLKRFATCWLPLILYCLLIYIQSDNPSPEQIPSFRFFDKFLHFIAYGIMGILFYRAYQTLQINNNRRWLLLLSIASASLYGVSDEIHQSFVPFRSAEAADVIADFLGSICGVYLYHLWMNSRIDRRLRVLNSEMGMRKAELNSRDKK